MFSDATKYLVGTSIPSTHHDPQRAQHETMLRNAFETNDLEARRRENDMAAEKKTARENTGHNKGRAPYQNQLNQPKPKFVSHKAPNKAKGQKDNKGSNRLGDQLHYA
uniref:Uncharacterized protein n=1 Tax=Minutocellus polymorphus TaxID=265543 RepID=A0A7S0AWX1_9STRA|mmetsp:Transcript_6207/g.10362  ORF Transcript_6207/g.10362 Transcript_6207/m.10362 type:complete len:108 (+) Transcript_6207:144-467(+)